MKSIKNINSVQDAKNAYDAYPAQAKKLIRAMILEAKIWVRSDVPLAEGDDGVVDDTHRVEAVTEISQLQTYDVPARDFAMRVTRSAQNRYARQVTGIQLMLDQGDISSSDSVALRDDQGADHIVTVAELLSILSAYFKYVLLFVGAEITSRYQSEQVKDMNCKLYRIGLTPKTARAIIGEKS